MVIERCLQEQRNESSDGQPRSEPITGLLHGVPGAGKSLTLLWIRDFFERVCGWTHGVEFVYLASQNTMSFHVGGFTLHSYGDIPFAKKDGKTANVKNEVYVGSSLTKLVPPAYKFSLNWNTTSGVAPGRRTPGNSDLKMLMATATNEGGAVEIWCFVATSGSSHLCAPLQFSPTRSHIDKVSQR